MSVEMRRWLTDSLTSTPLRIKAGGGLLYKIYLENGEDNDVFVKFYSKSSSPTNADAPILSFAVLANYEREVNVDYNPPLSFNTHLWIVATELPTAASEFGNVPANFVRAHVSYSGT